MSTGMQAPAFFIGWDVGGWNCDKNGESRDAIVILDADAKNSKGPYAAILFKESRLSIFGGWCGNGRHGRGG